MYADVHSSISRGFLPRWLSVFDVYMHVIVCLRVLFLLLTPPSQYYVIIVIMVSIGFRVGVETHKTLDSSCMYPLLICLCETFGMYVPVIYTMLL